MTDSSLPLTPKKPISEGQRKEILNTVNISLSVQDFCHQIVECLDEYRFGEVEDKMRQPPQPKNMPDDQELLQKCREIITGCLEDMKTHSKERIQEALQREPAELAEYPPKKFREYEQYIKQEIGKLCNLIDNNREIRRLFARWREVCGEVRELHITEFETEFNEVVSLLKEQKRGMKTRVEKMEQLCPDDQAKMDQLDGLKYKMAEKESELTEALEKLLDLSVSELTRSELKRGNKIRKKLAHVALDYKTVRDLIARWKQHVESIEQEVTTQITAYIEHGQQLLASSYTKKTLRHRVEMGKKINLALVDKKNLARIQKLIAQIRLLQETNEQASERLREARENILIDPEHAWNLVQDVYRLQLKLNANLHEENRSECERLKGLIAREFSRRARDASLTDCPEAIRLAKLVLEVTNKSDKLKKTQNEAYLILNEWCKEDSSEG